MRAVLALLLLSCFVAPYLVTPRDTEKGRVALSPRSDRLAIDAGAPSGRLVPVERRSVPPPATYVRIAPDGITPAVRRISGTATWYCSATSACTHGYRPSDMVAAIDTDLGFRKGDRIRVSYFGRSVVVRIVDVCGCAGDRLIDLTSGAFRRLAPLELGVIPVMLELAGPAPRAVPTAPATDR